MENTYLVIGALLVVVILLIWAYRSDSNTKIVAASPSSMNESFSSRGGGSHGKGSHGGDSHGSRSHGGSSHGSRSYGHGRGRDHDDHYYGRYGNYYGDYYPYYNNYYGYGIYDDIYDYPYDNYYNLYGLYNY